MMDFINGYTDFQKEHCILQKNGVTQWGMYVQCLREIEARKQADGIDAATAADLKWFERRAEELAEELGDIDHDRREALDEERYIAKASKELLLDLLATGRPARSTLDLIACLPDRDSHRLFRVALGMEREKIVKALTTDTNNKSTNLLARL